METTKIKNGDVFDIGQTVNGVSEFIWFANSWYYFGENMYRKYEYDQEDLTNTVLNIDYFHKITFIRNVFDNY